MSEQLPSETKLDELKRLCEPMGGEPMRMVSRLELLALVECAEAAKRFKTARIGEMSLALQTLDAAVSKLEDL
jgi:hypothetical protein